MTLIEWFLWRRWKFKSWHNVCGGNANDVATLHEFNVYGCKSHPIIMKDMLRIVWGVK